MKLPVTYLFVPGDRPERFDKAVAAGADAVILDLEDAVVAAGKDAAREAVGKWLLRHRDLGDRLVVRINGVDSAWFEDDLALMRSASVQRVMLPKVEAAAQVARVMAALPLGGRVLPLIESARGSTLR